MDYDVLILGGGIIGCAAAYELSKYSLNIALIEKEYDIADDVSLVNAAIVYDGIETKDDTMAKLELAGNRMFDDLSKKFNIPFRRNGSLLLIEKDDGSEINSIYKRAKQRGIKNMKLIDGAEAKRMEPALNIDVKFAIYSHNIGVVCPYDLALSYGEVAYDNGVNFKLQEEVLSIKKFRNGFQVVTNKNKFTCRLVINTTPVNTYLSDFPEEDESLGNRINLQYFIMDKEIKPNFKNTLFILNNKRERIFAVPNAYGDTILALSSKDVMPIAKAESRINSAASILDEDFINTHYRLPFYNESMIIDDRYINEGYLRVVGKHYGQVTITPALANNICSKIVSILKCKPKKDYYDKRREYYKFRSMSNEERNNLIKSDKRYGNMVCVCQKVTEGEIVDSIRRPLGARTIEGIKRRTGALLGSCKGSLCYNKVAEILARETDKDLREIVIDSSGSNIFKGRIKEFDSI